MIQEIGRRTQRETDAREVRLTMDFVLRAREKMQPDKADGPKHVVALMRKELLVETIHEITNGFTAFSTVLEDREVGVPSETSCIGGEGYSWLSSNCAHVDDDDMALVGVCTDAE